MALDPEDVARSVSFALSQPPHVQIAQLYILPVNRW
jgi:NADP-dependent 3-hydroxy acid dehydrogenase YdfG